MTRIKSNKTWRKHIPGGGARKKVPQHYYSGIKNKQRIKIKRIVWAIVIILLLQAVFQVKFLRLDIFELTTNQDLVIEDIQPTLDKYLDASRFIIFKNNNYFLFNQDKLLQELKDQYNLDEVKLNKKFPGSLEIILREKVSQFIYRSADTLYLLSAQGTINRQISSLDSKYLVLEEERSNPPQEGQILDTDKLSAINSVYLAWQEVLGNEPRLIGAILSDDLTAFEVKTQIGFRVIVDLTKDINIQLNNLKKVLAGNIVGQDIDYIDLRFGDRVFFK